MMKKAARLAPLGCSRGLPRSKAAVQRLAKDSVEKLTGPQDLGTNGIQLTFFEHEDSLERRML
jgi:hypothetical protein